MTRSAQRSPGRIEAAVVFAVMLACVAFADSVRAQSPSRRAEVRTALETELELTRRARLVGEGLAALERERASLEHAADILEYTSAESLRRVRAYAASREAREHHVRTRTRALYKLARGGALRLVLEDGAGTAHGTLGTGARRIVRGRTIRRLVAHDAEELDVFRSAELRARRELLATARELQAMSGLRMVHAVATHAMTHAAMTVDSAAASAHRRRRRLAPGGVRGREQRQLLALVKRERRGARAAGGPHATSELDLVAPTRGRIVGRAGAYVDPVLQLDMHRNGIELTARRGERVRAVAAGEVSFVGAVPGYDRVVVVDHGRGYVSLVGRLADVVVSPGEMVEAGDIVGRAAPKAVDDGLGRTVYLELRHGDRPIDPATCLGD
jgi:septal ring factor EnvC (AmiA/AmiB activator)